jgi:uncharacterized protein (DUF1330 family)
MAALMIVVTKVLQSDGWTPYQTQVGDCFASYGGKYVVKRAEPDVLEGSFEKDRVTIFEFPSVEAIHALWASPEYTEIRKLRDGLGQLDVWVVPQV